MYDRYKNRWKHIHPRGEANSARKVDSPFEDHPDRGELPCEEAKPGPRRSNGVRPCRQRGAVANTRRRIDSGVVRKKGGWKVTITKGGWSPWGEIQTTEVVVPGITRVTTAAHGGLPLDEFTLALMPECMRRNHGSFEEDEEWAFVFAVFEGEIRELGSKENAKTLNSGLHLEILKREWPEEYAEWRSHAA